MEGIYFLCDVHQSFSSLYYAVFTVGCCLSPQQPAAMKPFFPARIDCSLERSPQIVIVRKVRKENSVESISEHSLTAYLQHRRELATPVHFLCTNLADPGAQLLKNKTCTDFSVKDS